MGKIVIFDNPMDANERREFEHTGPFIDWLLVQYPTGFPTPHVTAFNLQPLRVEDYDRVIGENDLVVIGLIPALPPGVIVALGWLFIHYIAPVLISYALSYIATNMFGKAGSSGSDSIGSGTTREGPSSVYSLSTPTNTARLGQVIPVLYGQVLAVPDLASTPYSWYENNEMYVGMLFCLGQGWHTVSEVRVANTPVNQLASGTVTYDVWAPDRHNQFFGMIQGSTGWYENVYTSPEVSDQELDRAAQPGPPGPGDCQYFSVAELDDVACSLHFHIEYTPPGCTPGTIPPAIPDCVAAGQHLTIANTNSNNGTFLITSVVRGTNIAEVFVSPCLVDDTLGRSFNVSTAYIEDPFDDNQLGVLYCTFGGDSPLDPGMFEYTDVGKNITISWLDSCDPSGFPCHQGSGSITGTIKGFQTGRCYTEDSPIMCPGVLVDWDDLHGYGPFDITNVSFEIWTSGDVPVITFECGGGTPTPVRNCADGGIGPFVATNPGWTTSKLSLDLVFPGGLYTAAPDGTLGAASVTVKWIATQVDDEGLAIGDSFTKMETVTRSTNTPQRVTFWWDLPNARYSVCALRTSAKSSLAADYSNVLWTGLKAVLDSKGHAVYHNTTIIAVKAKATNGLAGDALNRFSVRCTRQLPNYQAAGEPRIVTKSHTHAFYDIYRNSWYGANRPATEVEIGDLGALWASTNCLSNFNAIYDTAITVWEALSLSVAGIHAFPATAGSQLTVVQDAAKETASHCFNTSNIVKDSLQLSYKFNDLGTEDGVEIEYRDPDTFEQMFVLHPASSLEPEKITLFGCTNEQEALRYAQRIWRQRLYRREFVKFTTELEGHLPLVGGLISIDHPVLNGNLCYIVGSVTPEDEFKVTIEGHRYIASVYKDRPIVPPGGDDPYPVYIDINAKTQGILELDDIDGGYARGITLYGYYPSETIKISLVSGRSFTAWSRYGLPAYDPALPNTSGASNEFYSLSGPNASTFTKHGADGPHIPAYEPEDPGPHSGVWDSYAAAFAGCPVSTLTGHSQYTFVMWDGLFTDNTGGLSIKVEIVY